MKKNKECAKVLSIQSLFSKAGTIDTRHSFSSPVIQQILSEGLLCIRQMRSDSCSKGFTPGDGIPPGHFIPDYAHLLPYLQRQPSLSPQISCTILLHELPAFHPHPASLPKSFKLLYLREVHQACPIGKSHSRWTQGTLIPSPALPHS